MEGVIETLVFQAIVNEKPITFIPSTCRNLHTYRGGEIHTCFLPRKQFINYVLSTAHKKGSSTKKDGKTKRQIQTKVDKLPEKVRTK